MADTKISGLTALVGSTVSLDADVLVIVDTSTTTTKKILVQELYNSAINLTTLAASLVSADSDSMPIVDASAVVTKRILVSQMQELFAVPVGVMFDFGGTAVPTGYLGCDGTAVSRTTYSSLFTAISTTWGVGDGATTFNLPDFRRRTSVGSGGSGTGTLGNAVGNTGGSETHTLVTGELAAHTHTLASGTVDSQGSHTHTYTTYPGGAGSDQVFGGGGSGQLGSTTGADGAHTHNINALSLNNAGSGTAHNNLQPSAIVLKIIKT